MWYTLTALSHLTNPQTHGRLTPRVLLAHLLGPMTTWFGNLIGALFVSYVMSICTETLTSEPYASGVKEMIMSEIVEPAWGVLILKAVGCGWIVSLAMYMSEVCASQIQDLWTAK
jgi:formate/nitrite transporter FocA (FNT family)